MYKRVNAKMFADKLMEIEDNTSVVFAKECERKMEIGDSIDEENACWRFYYAKKVYDEQYNSWYIVIDYLGGGEAHIIALDWGKSDQENYDEILQSVQHFMTMWIHEIYLEV